jgi:hypothetical protein
MLTSTNNFRGFSEILEPVFLYGFSRGKSLEKQKAFTRKAFAKSISDPGGIRTPNQQSRNLPFYPIELRSQKLSTNITYFYTIKRMILS